MRTLLILAIASIVLCSCAHTPRPGEPGYRTCTHYSYHTNVVTGVEYQEAYNYNCN